jgi:hypothetical protein
MAEMMNYDKSPVPTGTRGISREVTPDRGISSDGHSGMSYESAAATGHLEIMVPSQPGSPRETETLHARDFGQHVIGKIESSMKRQGYMTTGPQQDAVGTLRHYLAVAKGSQLLDAGALKRGNTLADELEREGDREEYFRQVVKPWLGSLTPARRR